jgi:pimeloyl-ACP methyl ester carboxylesterase
MAELSNVQDNSNHPLISCPKFDQSLAANEEIVVTSFGSILVAHQGCDLKQGKPVFVTFHDLGLNHSSNFDDFFDSQDNKILLQSFSVLHINAPGQESFASSLPEGLSYPTMEQLSLIVEEVVDYFKIKQIIGFGCGVGSNVLLRFCLRVPERFEGLFLINPSCTKAAWSEWFFQRKNIRSLRNNNRSSLLPAIVQDFLMWYHFGTTVEKRTNQSKESMEMHRSAWKGIQMNPYNLSLFIESYINRTEMNITRDNRDSQPKCQTVILVGDYSPQMTINESVDLNSKLDPSKTTWIKLSESGMVLQEQLDSVARVLRLFLQGLGYTLKAFERRRALMAGTSMPCLSTGSTGTDSVSTSSINVVTSAIFDC